MPYYNRDPKRDQNFDNHPYIDILRAHTSSDPYEQGFGTILRPHGSNLRLQGVVYLGFGVSGLGCTVQTKVEGVWLLGFTQ